VNGLDLLAVLLAASPASGTAPDDPTGPLTIDVVARDDGLRFWFEVDGIAGKNPRITVPQDTPILFRFENQGTVEHNVRLGPTGEGIACCSPPGGRASFEVMRVSPNAREYFCEPHYDLGMMGKLGWAGARTGAPTLGIVGAAASLAMGLGLWAYRLGRDANGGRLASRRRDGA
jgi:hypothetical protein